MAVSESECWAMVNRTQALVLGFFVVALSSLVVILVAAPEVYDQALRLPDGSGVAEVGFLVGLTGFLGLLAVGVLRRWRWIFWLVLVAFLAGVLRVPVAILQLTGVLAADVPPWYVTFQGVIGLVQVAVGLAMLAGYRRSGVWGSFLGTWRPRRPGVTRRQMLVEARTALGDDQDWSKHHQHGCQGPVCKFVRNEGRCWGEALGSPRSRPQAYASSGVMYV